MNFTEIGTAFWGFTKWVNTSDGGVHEILGRVYKALIFFLLTLLIPLQKFLNFHPFTNRNLPIDQGLPKIHCSCVPKRYIDLSGLLVRSLVRCEQHYSMAAVVFRLSNQVVSQVIGLYFAVFFVLDHHFVSGPVQSDVFYLPYLQVEASALTQSLNRFDLHLSNFRWTVIPLWQVLKMFH